jgi:magnesium transporter
MLSESHPTYLTQLRVSLAKTKEYTDKAILMVTVVSIGILCIQLPIGMLQLSFCTSEFTICFS